MSDVDNDVTMVVVLKLSWTDNRLVPSSNVSKKLDPNILESIWKPDFFVPRAKRMR